MSKPLEGILVIDFCQFLSGPSASLRLADLGARVIKIEKPVTGDISRQMYISNIEMNGASTVFHAINRNKESYTVDLKTQDGLEQIKTLIEKADVVMHNFRPKVMKRIGLDFASVKSIKKDIIYAEISGYGEDGPWQDKPGQDLLLQAITGICMLSGDRSMMPVPMGISLIDITCGTHLCQGILAGLFRRDMTGEGALVQVSMLESACDLQFESITSFLNDGNELPERTTTNNANAYLGAPYGIYKTGNGYIAIAMASVTEIGKLTGCEALLHYPDPASWFTLREEIKSILQTHLKTAATEHWLSLLEQAGIWCSPVLSWKELVKHEGFKCLNMVQQVQMRDGYTFLTTRCPIVFDGEILYAEKGTPKLGEDNRAIQDELFNHKKLATS